MAFIGLTILFLIGAAPIVGFGLLLHRRKFVSRLSFPWVLAALHTAILSVCVALYPTGIFLPDSPFYDDVYIAYLFFPGIFVYCISGAAAVLLSPWLQTVMSYHAASLMCIVFIPGIVGLVLGAAQWYFIGCLMDRYGLTKSPERTTGSDERLF